MNWINDYLEECNKAHQIYREEIKNWKNLIIRLPLIIGVLISVYLYDCYDNMLARIIFVIIGVVSFLAFMSIGLRNYAQRMMALMGRRRYTIEMAFLLIGLIGTGLIAFIGTVFNIPSLAAFVNIGLCVVIVGYPILDILLFFNYKRNQFLKFTLNSCQSEVKI